MIDESLIRLRIQRDLRGKITNGMKNEQGLPVKLNYFRIDDFPELVKAYGEKPITMLLFCPTDNMKDFFIYEMVKWGKKDGQKDGVRTRTCNGKKVKFHVPFEYKGKKYEAGKEYDCMCTALNLDPNDKEDKKRMCRADVSLDVFIYCPDVKDLQSPLCYRIQCHSKNSGDEVYSALTHAQKITGGKLFGVPFMLSVRMVQSKDDPRQKFPIWQMRVMGLIPQLKKLLGQAGSNFIMPHDIEEEPLALLSEATEVVAIEEPDAEEGSPSGKEETVVAGKTDGDLFDTPLVDVLNSELDNVERFRDIKKLMAWKAQAEPKLKKLTEPQRNAILTKFAGIINSLKA